MNTLAKAFLQDCLCTDKAQAVYCAMKQAQRPQFFGLPPGKPKFRSFVLSVPLQSNLFSSGITHVQIEVPVDAVGNRLQDGVDNDTPPKVVQCTFLNARGDITLQHPSNQGKMYYTNLEHLVRELERIRDVLVTH